jgi:hypothetical protein
VAVLVGGVAAGAAIYFVTRDRHDATAPPPQGVKPGVPVISPASAGGAPRAVGFALRF